MNKIVECVPNFSEGRDLQKIDRIVAPFRGRQGVKLLDYSNDEDHNRLVVTVVGEPEPLRDAVLEAIGVAVQLIDLNRHQGQHPRMGAVDVVPFIPIRNVTMEEAVALSKEVGAEVAKREYKIKDEDILNAIRYHTTGRAGMSVLEKIVFIADYIEPNREQFEGLDEARRLAYLDLDMAMRFILEQTIEFVKERGRLLHPLSLEALEYYKNR